MERRESTKAKTGFGCPNPRDMGLAESKRAGQAAWTLRNRGKAWGTKDTTGNPLTLWGVTGTEVQEGAEL